MCVPVAAVALLLLGSCALIDAQECASQGGNLVRSEIETFESNANEFALHLYKNGRQDKENMIFSPVSIAIALGMVLEGASGTTKAEILAFLGQNLNENNLGMLFNRLVMRLNANQGDYQLSTANRIFVDKQFRISPSYQEKLSSCFLAEAAVMDVFRPVETSNFINSWVANQTRNKIRDLITPDVITPDLVIALVNAIYFKAEWHRPFVTENGGRTRPMNFHLLDGSMKQTDFMTMTSTFWYADADNAQILAIPYKSGTLHMFIMLPHQNTRLNDFEASLTHEKLTQMLDSVRETDRVQVHLPKFKVEAEYPLKDVLQNIGMRTMFTPGAADLSLMALMGDSRLYVGEAKHKAFIEVNENGTEAAAATFFGANFFSARPPPPVILFLADRPFLFAISHMSPTKSLLFFGRITDPQMA